MSASRSPRALGGRLRDLARVVDRAARRGARSRASGARIVSRVDRQLLQRACSARRGSAAPCRSPCSAGSARRMTSLRSLAAAGDAGAELVEDERQPLALGLAHDVADQVEVDRLGACASTGSRYWPLPGPFSILSQRGGGSARRRRACVGVALDEALADQRLRAHDAARVLAEVLVARVGDVEHDGGLVVVGDVERVDLADLHAGDLDVLARDHEAGVVEDRAHLVAPLARRRARDARRPRRPRATRAGRWRASRLMGRGAPGLGSQSSGPRLPSRERRRAVRRRAGSPRPGSA